VLFGAEDEPGVRWPELALARGPLLPGSLTGVLPLMDGVRVLTWARDSPPPALTVPTAVAVVDAARCESGVVVLDLPRALDDASAAAACAADLILLVVPAQLRAVASARRGLGVLQECCPDVRLVVRTMRDPAPSAEEIAAALNLPLAGTLGTEPGLRAALEHGEPPGVRRRGPLSRLSRQLVGAELRQQLGPGGRPRSTASVGWLP
jgi:secretion/DNA translocation related CpaE-like protein